MPVAACLLPIFQHQNSFLYQNFGELFSAFNTLDLFVDLLQPSGILVVEGNHHQFESLAIIGKNKSVPVICIQQGWPSILHTRFKNMQYSHFLSWGKQFSSMYKNENPKPQFISTGYPFEVKNCKNRNAISFFLQAPVLISTSKNYNELLELAFFCASQFPKMEILIREHPEYALPKYFAKQISLHTNIILVSPKNHSLSEIFSKSIVGISIFSSTIIEGLAHGVIPFIYNPDLMPNYYPDLDKEHLGIEAKSLKEAKLKITELIHDSHKIEDFQRQISNKQINYFASLNQQALETTIKTIQNIQSCKQQ